MKNSIRNLKTLSTAIVVVSVVLVYFLFQHTFSIPIAISATTDNVSGFVWSENIGWMSFNSTSDASPQPYGVRVDTTSKGTGGIGAITGTTWSEHIGWVSFDRAQTGNPPSAPYAGGSGPIAQVDWATGAVTGWMRALSACQNDNLNGSGNCTSSTAGNVAGGWDGWIKLSDESNPLWAGNGVKIIANKFSGWAWGSDVVGWVDFSPVINGISVGPIVEVFDAPDIVAENLTSTGALTAGNTITFSGATANRGAVGMNTTNSYKLIKLGGAPSLVGSALFDVTVVGDYAYTTVVGNDQDIETFNISDPYNPVNMGAIETWFNGNFEILNRGSYLYAMKGDSGQNLHVLDISTPATPVLVGSAAGFGSSLLGMDIVGSYAYLATSRGGSAGPGGLEIYDITNPLAPFEVGTPGNTVSLNDTASEAAVFGDYAYLAGQAYDTSSGAGFIDVFNVANRTSPIRGIRIFTPSRVQTAVVNDSYLYVNSAGNMRIYSLSNPANPLLIKEVAVNVDIQKIRIIGSYAYVIGYTATNGVRIYDITNPASPVLVGRATASSGSSSILPTLTKVYTANSNSVVGGHDLDIFEPHTFSRFCIDNPSCLTTTTGRLGGKDFDAGTLAVNSTYATSTSWTATLGAHTAYFCTDTKDTNGFDGVAESNETNNCQSISFTVTPAPIKTNSISPLSPTATIGNPITFTSTASFSDNSMTNHNLNWKKQGGCWNWETCYLSNASVTQSNYSFPATGSHSLSTTFTPLESGTYEVQAAAYDGVTWTYSPLATVTITCSTMNGEQCTSAANSCGMVDDTGTIQCDGSCSVATPSDQLCAPASECGNGICEGSGRPPETPLTCPRDCKVKVKQF